MIVLRHRVLSGPDHSDPGVIQEQAFGGLGRSTNPKPGSFTSTGQTEMPARFQAGMFFSLVRRLCAPPVEAHVDHRHW